ncbi:outer membrane insertion C-terminal signal domain protein [Collimonas fungivorans]|uniref:Outer membrane insertion C-terminal signal domain protein n=1 Tax=Collimonas fungivorans TaxID=158899 RepID=A0A127P9S6_9BURK|nr:porin [Collimonas fungivorans]AMO94508.1 outer membrane insertion C-terminal signal domain protein [Collimonas fungivorans]
MRKSVLKALPLAKPLAVAAALACALVGQAQAQTSVTIYGRVDAGINYQSNQVNRNADGSITRGGQWGIGGNEWGTSMFGIKGTEDLGGGLKALFTLENGFDASNGQVNGGSGLWTRRSFVGLNGSLGTVKIGRDLALPSDRVWSIDPTGQQNMSTSTLFKGRNWPQTSNQIQYITPDMGGLYVHVMYGAGEAAGSFTRGPTGSNIGNSTGIAVGFVQPNYELLAMYDTARSQSGEYNDLFSRSKEITVGGNVTISKVKLYAGWQNLSAPAQIVTTDGTMAAANKANQFWLGANYQLTPALTLIGAAYHVKLNHDVGSANLFMVGTNYSLSKRTLLYASVGTIRNGSNTDFQVQTGSSDGLVGQNQSTFYTGISHSF